MSIRPVALKASNGQYVSAESGGGGIVVANRAKRDAWETFNLLDLGGGKVALQASNGMYLCAEGGGGGGVVANRTSCQSWETFKRIDRGAPHIALQVANGMYVCAERGGGSVVVANRTAVAAWETFELVELPGTPQTPPAPSDVKAAAMPWGLVLTLSHQATQDLSAGTLSLSAVAGVVAAVPGATVVAGVVAGALAAAAGLVKAVDHGKGVYLTMLWVTPGLFVPTAV
jgi:hypothetical protein